MHWSEVFANKVRGCFTTVYPESRVSSGYGVQCICTINVLERSNFGDIAVRPNSRIDGHQ